MEQVLINATVNVKGGPLLKANSQVKTGAYAVASLPLAAAATDDTTILPVGATAAMMLIQARKEDDQSAAKVEVTPEGTATGTKLEVDGSLLVANSSVLAGLATGGPRKLTVKNTEADPVVVSVLIAFDA